MLRGCGLPVRLAIQSQQHGSSSKADSKGTCDVQLGERNIRRYSHLRFTAIGCMLCDPQVYSSRDRAAH